jgi:hypothetical protein
MELLTDVGSFFFGFGGTGSGSVIGFDGVGAERAFLFVALLSLGTGDGFAGDCFAGLDVDEATGFAAADEVDGFTAAEEAGDGGAVFLDDPLLAGLVRLLDVD